MKQLAAIFSKVQLTYFLPLVTRPGFLGVRLHRLCRGHFESREKLLGALLTVLQEGDTVLFKGSRGMKLEQVVDALINARTITRKK